MAIEPARDERATVRIVDLGRVGYAEALAVQRLHHTEVLEARASGAPESGRLLLVEHAPVVTLSRRPGADAHLLASPDRLAALGIEVAETDRGGDITYHGPGQIVVYPIIDLNTLGLRVHAYLRLLEQAAIHTCQRWGVRTGRDPEATGVWTLDEHDVPHAKIAAIGIRVRRWVTLHGMAFNVRTDLSHFSHIIPCGLAGRPVTSLEHELGDRCPSTDEVRDDLAARLCALLDSSSSPSA